MTVDITIQQDEQGNFYASSLVMYSTSVSFSSIIEYDLEERVQKVDNFNFKIVVPYNVHVQVNLSIVPTLCGQSGREVLFTFPFHYSKLVYNRACMIMIYSFIYPSLIANCGHPVSTLMIKKTFDRTFPVTAGSIFNFTCPPGLVLTGPSTATCMENGEWEPDPSEAECIAIGNISESLTNYLLHSTFHYS